MPYIVVLIQVEPSVIITNSKADDEMLKVLKEYGKKILYSGCSPREREGEKGVGGKEGDRVGGWDMREVHFCW